MMHVPRALAVSLAVVAFVATCAASSPARAAGGSTAVVVIDTGSSVRSAVIHFDGPIDGIQALELAGANPVTYGFSGQGAAVCAIDGVGNPAGQSCLIGPNSEYWAYYLAHGGSGSWAYSRGCACTVTVQDGDVEGWRYGLGAAPRASADFCAYVACAAPPTVPQPAPTGGGGGSDGGGAVPPVGGGGGTTAGDTGGGGAGTPGAEGGPATGATDPAATAEAPSTPTGAPTSTTRVPVGRTGEHEEAQVKGVTASQGGAGGDDDPGSPVGVAVAAGVLAATAVGAVAIRRRRMRGASGP